MKGKMTIVLLSLVLVFGMIAASCDDGTYSDNPYKNDPTKTARDWKRSPLVPKVAQPDILLSTLLTGLSGTLQDNTAGNAAIAGKPIQFVGNSTLAVSGSAVTVTSADGWGGGLDVKIGSGADKIDLKPDAKVVVKTSASGATGTWALRIKTDDYSGGSDSAITPGTDLTVTLNAADIEKIASGNGCIRINTSATGSVITVTDIVFTNYAFAD